ncbi:unnamed protein product [Rotaria sordida]|uniref:HAT C-terminal dimerisation domain-containing protein n=1 Tax=Rotaria sordida TaxID=392033 RepID=A0A815GZV6_9BILA|nr:unnamed protein product [Rotaria sordida]CAF1347357.1 unnamed protein product [Rotaria sordida]CAF3737182.1 unnamed protein product [Rotaria sordida]CAF4000945.1 unnamed protein product [Rotaria sordida]CAF4174078.1 unnamed protein product [Rotaria sordida]
MIELHDLCPDESLDSTSSSNTDHSSSIIASSLGQCSSSNIKYNPLNIKLFLKEQPEKYLLVDNHKVNNSKPSPCWNRFALPAVKIENNRNVVIKNFATCRSCYATYVYTYGSTKSLNSHKCTKESSSTSTSPSTKSPSLNFKINRSFSEKKKTLTSLVALWVCQSIRPISIVEDEGFLNIIKQCVSWNGGPFNNINGNDILPSRSTITREINRQANDIRERLGVVLRKAAKQECLAISPDLWSDKFKQNSYLGLTAHFVDDQHILHSIDLCCEPYNELDKTAGNVLKSITAALSRFGLDQLMNEIIFVCDRGSNLLKALEDYQVVHCFPHRLNNIVKRTFYSAGSKEKKQRKQKKESLKKNRNDDQSNWNNSNDDDNDSLMYYDDRDSSESESDDDIVLDEKFVELALRSLSSSPAERDHINVLEENLPPYAAQILATIVRCKQLCCYVKRVNWNPMLEALKKPTIKQEIIVRWLTMSQLLESILSSYSALTSIASEKGAIHTLPTIDVSTVATINGLFLPWKQVIERLQATNTPSLHIAVTSYWYLLDSLVVTKDEAAEKAAKGVVFFKRRARQLLKAMFSLHDLHWVAAVLNPHTRMLKHATDVERAHAYCLVRARIAKLMEIARIDNNEEVLSSTTTSLTPPPRKKFKSYTTQFHDDTDLGETSSNMTIVKRARRELEIYLQLNLTNCKYLLDDIDNPLLFWKEQEHVLPNMSRLAKQIFSIPASSAAVERAFSSAGIIISQRRTNINPSTVNDIILIRSAAAYLKTHI